MASLAEISSCDMQLVMKEFESNCPGASKKKENACHS